jgi:hypothetical protein
MTNLELEQYKQYDLQREILMHYLQVMFARADWHGVADAAMDIRELEAEQKREPSTVSG